MWEGISQGGQGQTRLETNLETHLHLQFFKKIHVGSPGIHFLHLKGSNGHPAPPKQLRNSQLSIFMMKKKLRFFSALSDHVPQGK